MLNIKKIVSLLSEIIFLSRKEVLLLYQHKFKTDNNMVQVTFWKSDFIGDNLEQLVAILKQDAVKGTGSWFILKTNFIQAFIDELQYEFIMRNVANYGNPELNK